MPRIIAGFTGLSIPIYLVYLALSDSGLTVKPNLGVVTSGLWLEVLVSLSLFLGIAFQKWLRAIFIVSFSVFGAVLIGRFTGSITNFEVTSGHNLYLSVLYAVEVVALVGSLLGVLSGKQYET
ncbi:MAG: hypothetical protein JXR18_01885 [Neptuniibacter sp.]